MTCRVVVWFGLDCFEVLLVRFCHVDASFKFSSVMMSRRLVGDSFRELKMVKTQGSIFVLNFGFVLNLTIMSLYI